MAAGGQAQLIRLLPCHVIAIHSLIEGLASHMMDETKCWGMFRQIGCKPAGVEPANIAVTQRNQRRTQVAFALQSKYLKQLRLKQSGIHHELDSLRVAKQAFRVLPGFQLINLAQKLRVFSMVASNFIALGGEPAQLSRQPVVGSVELIR